MKELAPFLAVAVGTAFLLVGILTQVNIGGRKVTSKISDRLRRLLLGMGLLLMLAGIPLAWLWEHPEARDLHFKSLFVRVSTPGYPPDRRPERDIQEIAATIDPQPEIPLVIRWSSDDPAGAHEPTGVEFVEAWCEPFEGFNHLVSFEHLNAMISKGRPVLAVKLGRPDRVSIQVRVVVAYRARSIS